MNITKVHYNPADQVTIKAAADLVAGQFVVITGEMDGRNPVAGVADAGVVPFGVAAHDCPAGEHVMVYRSGHIVDVTASAAINAGANVSTASGGKAVTAATGPVAGIALTKGTAGNPVTVALT
ncbi:hypothetical protein CKALI_11310 [Corynebacterium kalinowskii]|uniref:DUF2190 domain-containing protein n=1 Tax=Corynebacterium kalinowskii TaxID=2675216 RepID=A0A6B8VWM0_9CORY|nr:capsid cement protein [Corynebacterium kalinowskii]QGU03106.1 hypothetical protein CKALI_11310 [Corynebacterium kalinowskii]